MPVLKIQPAGKDNSDIEYFKLYLDGNMLAEMLDDKEKEFQILEGRHSIKARAGIFISNEIYFSVGADDTKMFTLSGYKNHGYIYWIPLILILVNTFLKHYYNLDYFPWILGLLVVLFIYKLTIGKNKNISLVAVN